MNGPARRLGLAALLCVASVLAPFLSDACLAADTAEGNTVTIDGTVVTIDVRVDVVLRPDLVDEENVAVFSKLQDGINAYWNSAFDALRYRDCLELKVDVVLTVVALDNIGLASAPGDYIKVTTTPGHHVMIFAIGSQDAPDYLPRPAVVDPYGPKAAPGEDYVSPYQHDLDGTWSIDMEPGRDFAHEVGHLLGLGDDYRNVPAARGAAGTESLDGREGTLMDSGDYIDQNIVDRVGKLIEKAGKQLPDLLERHMAPGFEPQLPGRYNRRRGDEMQRCVGRHRVLRRAIRWCARWDCSRQADVRLQLRAGPRPFLR